jgi:hypothetical protein
MSTNEYVRFQRSDHVLCNGQINENLPTLFSVKLEKERFWYYRLQLNCA